jgi:hypothetical protein
VEIDANGKLIGEPQTIYFVVGLDTTPIDEQEYSEIKQLAESPSLMVTRSLDEILVQAKSFLEQRNYRMTILESIIALEFALSAIVRNSLQEKGISKEKCESLIVSLGVSQILDVGLNLLIPQDLPPQEVIQACKEANRIRNKIVHRAAITVTGEEAQNAFYNVDSFIRQVRQKIFLES